MTADTLRGRLEEVLPALHDERSRYRCVVFQARDLNVITAVCSILADSLRTQRQSVNRISARDLIDSVGAPSCDATLGRIFACSQDSPVILDGPLLFLDYWSDGVQAAFWRELSTVSRGRSIFIVDCMRDKAVLPVFELRAHLPSVEARILTSRLEATEDTRR